MTQYASSTSVPADRSRAEIEWILKRYGAGAFMYGTKGDKVIIGFEASHRNIKITMDLPPRAEFDRDNRGRARTEKVALSFQEQAIRQRWRALALVVKAKLEAVESKVATFEQEFLPYMVLPGGRTVAEELVPKLAAMYAGGKVPPLLLAAGDGGKS